MQWKLEIIIKCLNDENQYKIWRNKVVDLIKVSKREQYSTLINENNTQPNSVWKLFRELKANKQTTNMGSFSLKSEDVEIDNPIDIANTFNEIFL